MMRGFWMMKMNRTTCPCAKLRKARQTKRRRTLSNLRNTTVTGRMSWGEVEAVIRGDKQAYGSCFAVWGWGSQEQHGPRMPLDTDALIAEHFAQLIARERHVLQFPTVPIGMSRHHEAFPGTVSLSQEAAYGVAASVLRSLHRMGVTHLFALMGHGGNVNPFHAAVQGLGKEIAGLTVCEPLDALFYTTEGELGELLNSFGETVSHAGAAECSIIYAIMDDHERRVDIADLNAVKITDDMVTLGGHGVGTQGGNPEAFRQMFPYGSKGDQRKSDTTRGRRMLHLMEQALLAKFDEFVTPTLATTRRQ
ncbi:creatininase family protein [Candidatus Uhrbacteria bacterium]|nr:creatininase family protein [Candidatus Uhrbacteria bacterium]